MNNLISEHIDFHSHILPEIDDGSENFQMSVSLLDSAKKNGISKVMATPHFYPHRDNTEQFLALRNDSFNSLKPYAEKIGIEIACGAEILVYPGVEQMKDIEKLSTDGCYLLELPLSFSLITSEHLDTVKNMKSYGQVILAHAHRYPAETVEELAENGILLQLNVSDICSFKGRKKAVEWYKKGYVYAVGSDVHHSPEIYRKFKKAISILTKEQNHD